MVLGHGVKAASAVSGAIYHLMNRGDRREEQDLGLRCKTSPAKVRMAMCLRAETVMTLD